MSVRAKMKCEAVSKSDYDVANGGGTVTLRPVINGSKENESFYKYTPGGSLVLATINEAAISQFEIGKEYYVDVSLAEG